jgi:hypothetical protein
MKLRNSAANPLLASIRQTDLTPRERDSFLPNSFAHGHHLLAIRGFLLFLVDRRWKKKRTKEKRRDSHAGVVRSTARGCFGSFAPPASSASRTHSQLLTEPRNHHPFDIHPTLHLQDTCSNLHVFGPCTASPFVVRRQLAPCYATMQVPVYGATYSQVVCDSARVPRNRSSLPTTGLERAADDWTWKSCRYQRLCLTALCSL